LAETTVFISYSRQDGKFMMKLAADLEKSGFDLWRDVEDLKPGTPNWERSIRQAIKDAGAVVLVASPAALESDYVQGELALAKYYHRPIYPVWADGESWLDCVPLDMSNYQYVDGRKDAYSGAIRELTSTLAKIFDTKDGVITLGLPTHETIELNLAQFQTGFDLLSYVWLNHLQSWYEPLAYGREWVIANVQTKQIAIPFQWLRLDVTNAEEMSELNLTAADYSYTDFGVKDGSYWAVWDARRLKAAALFANTAEVLDKVLSPNGYSEINVLLEQNRLRRVFLSDVKPNTFQQIAVFATFNKPDDRIAFVEI
jgi:hypothetical protein